MNNEIKCAKYYYKFGYDMIFFFIIYYNYA